MSKPRVYWEEAPEGFDPADSAWYSHIEYEDGLSIRQGHSSWEAAYTHAYLNAAFERIGM